MVKVRQVVVSDLSMIQNVGEITGFVIRLTMVRLQPAVVKSEVLLGMVNRLV